MIEEFNTPWMAFGGLELHKVRRIGSWVECWSGSGDIDVVLIQFEDELVAANWEGSLEWGAVIRVEDEDDFPGGGIRKLAVVADDTVIAAGFGQQGWKPIKQ